MRQYRGLEGDRKPLSVRYVGSLVADFHRNLLGGGVFAIRPARRSRRASCGCSTRRTRWRSSSSRRAARRSTATTAHARHPADRAASAHAAVHRQSKNDVDLALRMLGESTTAERLVVARHEPPAASTRPKTRHSVRAFPSSRSIGPTTRALDYDARPGRSGHRIRSRAASSRPCTAAGCGRCGSTPASAPRTRPTSASGCCSTRGQTGLSVAFDLPTQMGIDSDSPRALGEVGRVGRRDRHASRTCTSCSTASRSTRVSTSMTINATAATLLAMYIVVAEERGIARDEAERHDPERHPQGVHRARDVHLSARSRASRSSPTSSASAPPRCRTGIRSRSPAITSARRARRRCRSSRSPSRTPSST